MKTIIEKLSKEVGIDCIGFTSKLYFEELESRINLSKSLGYYNPFIKEETKERIDVVDHFPFAKGIIAVGVSHPMKHQFNHGYEITGKFSHTSWGFDYHQVLKSKMNDLIDRIKKEIPHFEGIAHVDTGPLDDRVLAYYSGLGYFGKNNLLINKKYGTSLFLGYIITNLDFLDSVVLENECGSCDICIKACPASALNDKGVLDGNKCFSYITQSKDELEEDIMKRLGNRMYGCDTCQTVCPKNKGVNFNHQEAFIPTGIENVDLLDFLGKTNKEYKSTYGHLAGYWRGKKILERNALIILGNSKNEKAIKVINDFIERDVRPDMLKVASFAKKQLMEK
jgi:epoxyqueuosine reductase